MQMEFIFKFHLCCVLVLVIISLSDYAATESVLEALPPMDCQDVQTSGVATTGVYEVSTKTGNKPIRVRCDMDTAGGGWTVIQRRGNFSTQENFDRTWQDYKSGFGSLDRDFWLGNDNIFALTNQGNYSLRLDMTAVNGESAYALYKDFKIGDEKSQYKLTVANYNGTAGDGMGFSNDRMFTTKDRKNYVAYTLVPNMNCAESWKGAFWFKGCAFCHPNGLYQPGILGDTSMKYQAFRGNYGLFSMEMKIRLNRRPMDCQELQATGVATSGVYEVWSRIGNKPIRVRCDMDTAGGGWTVFQRRGNFSTQENFDRNWQDYKSGFGSLEKDFWLGNDHIYSLSNQGSYALRLDMTSVDGESAYAEFKVFKIADENSNYRLSVVGYSGTAGNSLDFINERQFTTKDRKNDDALNLNCAERWKGAFWFKGCAFCHPNGLYQPGESEETSMKYQDFKGTTGLFSMDMKMKRL